MATSVDQISSAATSEATRSGGSALSVGGEIVSKNQFLQLLVAQIKNQNPLNPADGVEFLTQLAQFSQLEQLININTKLDSFLAGGTTETDGTSSAGSSDSESAV